MQNSLSWLSELPPCLYLSSAGFLFLAQLRLPSVQSLPQLFLDLLVGLLQVVLPIIVQLLNWCMRSKMKVSQIKTWSLTLSVTPLLISRSLLSLSSSLESLESSSKRFITSEASVLWRFSKDFNWLDWLFDINFSAQLKIFS